MRQDLIRLAAVRAGQLRRQAGITSEQPVCPVDLASQLGIEVRFVDMGRLEGTYWPGEPPIIALGAHRPFGRRAFTCAHELGHHVFGHGHRVDELAPMTDSRNQQPDEEVLADAFASMLLMPQSLIRGSFARRGWAVDDATAEQVFIVGCWFGVSYDALATQMGATFGLVSRSKLAALRREQPQAIRERLAGQACEGLTWADEHWPAGHPVDVEVGDLIRLPQGVCTDGPGVSPVGKVNGSSLVAAGAAGLNRAFLPGSDWACFIRVQPRCYVGRADYRHLEASEEEPD